MMKKATPEESEAATAVFWDMTRFPVPVGFDPRLVRPCIERFLESYGYDSGALTISAFFKPSNFSIDILRGVHSTGIHLTLVAAGCLNLLDYVYYFVKQNRDIDNIINISNQYLSRNFFGDMGYNLLEPFPSGDFFQCFLKAKVLKLSPIELKPRESPAYWDCFVCSIDPPGQCFENFTAHISSEEHRELVSLALEVPPVNCRSPSFKYPKPTVAPPLDPRTVVFWDINKCPVPPEIDPRLAGPYIRRHLKNEGYSGPFTITAVGLLTEPEVPRDVLRGVYYSGIRLTHVLDASKEIPDLIKKSPLSTKIVVIADPDPDSVYPSIHNISFRPSFVKCVPGELEEEEEKEPCSITGEWVCTLCDPDEVSKGFPMLTNHLSFRPHVRKKFYDEPTDVRISRKEPLPKTEMEMERERKKEEKEEKEKEEEEMEMANMLKKMLEMEEEEKEEEEDHASSSLSSPPLF